MERQSFFPKGLCQSFKDPDLRLWVTLSQNTGLAVKLLYISHVNDEKVELVTET